MPQLLKKAFYGLLLGFFGLFVVSSLFVRAEYNFAAYGDNPILHTQRPIMLIVLFILLLGLSVLGYKIVRKLNVYSAKIVVPIVLGISMILQVTLIFLLPRLPTDDSQTVVSLALDMLYRHDYSSFDTHGYLHMFPFNFSSVLYIQTLLAIFPDNYIVIKLFNIGFSLLTTFMIHLIYLELRDGKRSNDYGVLLLAAFYIPSLLMPNLIYNDVIGTALLTSAIYFVIRFVRVRHFRDIVFAALLLAVGNYFRGIGALILIAAAVYLLLNLVKIGVRRTLLSLLVLIALFNVPSWTQTIYLQATGVTNKEISENAAPVYMWLNMGINLERFGFWDEMESYRIYQREAKFDKAISTELYKDSIREKLSDASWNELLSMYYKKLIWVWTEGTYQIDRYGIGNETATGGRIFGTPIGGSYSYDTWMTRLFQGDSMARSILLWVLYASSILMYALSAVRLFTGIRNRRYTEVLPVLILLGFIAFYLLWEIKSRYLYPVYPLLLLLSYLGFKDTLALLANTTFGKKIGLSKEEDVHA
ncbi:glycosyltransferase family 39 protein [Saccharibacillus sp. JS10]|uniref:glycosyltransferase family 39 protein n=1 Tax=Saccharibacillus sp. JS10 TaxID=2950552 RepID=UPI00210C4516|nr:glycosyltransferase family 39 protein [Saccharibacillus sp. JS10]MCQ4086398.1 glycosyltransferase family 39 protein [Saccharibacillus sp. JS10]